MQSSIWINDPHTPYSLLPKLPPIVVMRHRMFFGFMEIVMLVKELKGEWPHHLIEQTPIWNRDVERLQPLDLTVFIRSHWGTPQYYEAIRQVESLIDVCWHATIVKELPQSPAITFCDPVPRQRITVDELCAWLSEVSLVRRRAVLFALETGMPVQEIIGLTWKKLHRTQGISDYGRAVAALGTRHFRIDYVFWEPLPNLAAAPLFGLADSIMEVSQGMGLDALARLYREALPFDTRADGEAFIADFLEDFAERENSKKVTS